MMAVNPATAWHMLNSFVKLQPGEWVLQNAGNSAVGHNVAAIAKSMGLRTVNLVRREDQIGPLLAAGADAAGDGIRAAPLRCRCWGQWKAGRPRKRRMEGWRELRGR